MPASAVRVRSRVAAPPKPTLAPAPIEAAITRMLARDEPQGDAIAPYSEQPNADAALFAFEPRLAPLVEAAAEASREHSRLENVAYEMVGPCPAAFTPEAKAWAGRLKAAQRKCGQAVAERRFHAAQDAVLAVLADLSRQPATTLPGLVFKARLAFEHASDDLGDSVLKDLIALGGSSAPSAVPCADPDPIFAAIDARVRAEAAYDAWDEAQGGRRTTASERAEENALSTASLAAYRRMLATVPTTAAGRLALLERLQVEMDLHGMANGDPPEAESLFWPEFFGALRGALGAVGLPDVGLAAALRERRAKADAFLGMMQREGFVPHPAHDPRCLMSIDLAIPLEAERLFGIAQAEFERRAEAYADFPPAERETHLTRMRAEYRLNELAAVVHGADASTQPSLVDQIVATWREWAALPANDETPEGEAVYERLSARRYALMDAAEELPATLENLPAKALALAWIEYVDLWSNGQSRDDYATDGRLALDIDTAILGRLRTEY